MIALFCVLLAVLPCVTVAVPKQSGPARASPAG